MSDGKKIARKKQQEPKNFKFQNLLNFHLEMGGLFGKQKKPQSRITEQDKAILVSKLDF